MSKKSLIILLSSISILSACSLFSGKEKEQLPQHPIYANEENTISLINQTTKVIVRCYSNFFEPAETCARFFEEKNYTRFREIPYKTANYDFLKSGSYPTRRWRNGERTPRW